MDSPPSSLRVESYDMIDDYEDIDELDFSGETERLTLSDQAYNADMESPNDMQLDSEELLNDVSEKDDADVAIIHPDEALPRADDCMYTPLALKLRRSLLTVSCS